MVEPEAILESYGVSGKCGHAEKQIYITISRSFQKRKKSIQWCSAEGRAEEGLMTKMGNMSLELNGFNTMKSTKRKHEDTVLW